MKSNGRFFWQFALGYYTDKNRTPQRVPFLYLKARRILSFLEPRTSCLLVPVEIRFVRAFDFHADVAAHDCDLACVFDFGGGCLPLA